MLLQRCAIFSWFSFLGVACVSGLPERDTKRLHGMEWPADVKAGYFKVAPEISHMLKAVIGA
jgi:hypothetical protein